MIIRQKDYGPQAFLINLRGNSRRLLPGIELSDMGSKTIHNDLDNARIGFIGYRCKRSDMLSRFTQVGSDGRVTQSNSVMVFERLFIGRLAISLACLRFATALFEKTKDYAEKKECWAPGGGCQKLANVPQVKSLLERGARELTELTSFANAVKVETCKYLHDTCPITSRLQQAISCCKVLGVDRSIELCHSLKQEVGSYALMSRSGFGQTDFLQGCKFAEGDSRILQLKMARDSMKSINNLVGEEREVAEVLNQKLVLLMQKNNGDKIAAWRDSWELVYKLALTHCMHVKSAFDSSKL